MLQSYILSFIKNLYPTHLDPIFSLSCLWMWSLYKCPYNFPLSPILDHLSHAGLNPAFTNPNIFLLSEFRLIFGVAISPGAAAPAELAAHMNHGIILDRCYYLCSVSKPIILTQIYVNTAVSWHPIRFTHIHIQGMRKLKVLFGLALPYWAPCGNPTHQM